MRGVLLATLRLTGSSGGEVFHALSSSLSTGPQHRDTWCTYEDKDTDKLIKPRKQANNGYRNAQRSCMVL